MLRPLLPLALLMPALVWLASTAAQGQSCGGVLENACAVSRTITLTAGAPALPAAFETCAPADSFLQGVTLFDIPPGYQLRIELTALSSDLDLFIHQPPGVCESDLQPSAYRLADRGGLTGIADECEVLTPAELAAYGCGWLALAVYSRDPTGGTASLDIQCEPAGTSCGGVTGCTGLCGDCNGDGMVNVLDALLAAQTGAGSAMPPAGSSACCDVDTSTSVTILDALLVAQFAAGLPVILSCP